MTSPLSRSSHPGVPIRPVVSPLVSLIAYLAIATPVGAAVPFETESVHAVPNIGGSWTAIATDSRGIPHIGYVDQTVRTVIHATRDATGGWEHTFLYDHVNPQPADIVSISNLHLDVDANDRAHLGFGLESSSAVNVYYIYNIDSPGSRDILIGSSAGATLDNVSMALDDADDAHMLWQIFGGTAANGFRYATNESGGWTNEIHSSSDVIVCSSIDARDGLVGYAFRPQSTNDLLYNVRIGGTWIEQIAEVGDQAQKVALALDPDGEPHVAYIDIAGRVRYATKPNGGPWQSQILFGGPADWPAIAAPTSDDVHIVFQAPDNQEIRYYCYCDGAWDSAIVDDTGDVGAYASIAVDAMDRVHVAYYDATNADPKYAISADCNGNGVADRLDISNGTDSDCNGNGIPDQCEIDAGAVADANGDGIPDDYALPVIADGSFEFVPLGTTPTTFGHWGQDRASRVTAQNGITPLDGSRMLKFLDSQYLGSGGMACDIAQLVSLCGVDTGAGGVTAEITGSFNRIAGDAETDRLFTIIARTYAGNPADFPSGNGNFLTESFAELVSDDDPATWEALTTVLDVPSNADYVGVWISAVEDVFNDSSAPEFDGHYADAVSMRVCDASLHAEPVVVDPGFEEQPVEGGGSPSTIGIWGGDIADAVTIENGIAPFEGDEMLKFIAASTSGPAAGLRDCDVEQLVSLCELPDIWSGGRTATVTAGFNRVAGDAETDREFGLRLRTYAGSPADFNGEGELADAVTYLDSDSDPFTWEIASTSLDIPAASQYMAIWLFASEDVFDDADGPEFDGHYADRVVLTFDGVVSVPSVDLLPQSVLGAPFPNPFSDRTTFHYELTDGSRTALQIFDVTGRLIRVLDRVAAPGRYTVTWDGTDRRGVRVPPGVYFLRLDSSRDETRRVILLR